MSHEKLEQNFLLLNVLDSAQINWMLNVKVIVRHFCFGDGSVKGPAVFVFD